MALAQSDRVPPRSALVLTALILGAVVSNINLGIANVALPSIGRDLGATQDQLTQIGDGFALGLAASVLYLGAIGDRYGRKMLFVAGAVLTIPTSMMAAWAPNPDFLAMSRVLCGLAAALLFPTTLSLIGALYSGRPQVKSIALWSGIGGGVAALGPVIGGWLLQYFWWGSVFLVALPLDVLALIIGLWVIPWHAGEETHPVDHLGGVLSVIGVGALVIGIQHLDDGVTPKEVILTVMTVAALGAFLWRQTRAPYPLVSLPLAKARTFWVAFVAGSITFGSLIGAMFIGQQFTQNVLGYNTFTAAAVVVPAAIMTALCGQIAGRIIEARGSRVSFLLGLSCVAAAFILMLATWRTGVSVWWILASYALVGAGVGLAATPASRSLMASVPATRTGMGSAFLDLTRDLGGAVIQAVMGVLLAGIYARSLTSAFNTLTPTQADQISQQAATQILSSYEGAVEVAKSYPQAQAEAIVNAAATAFTEGKGAAIGVGLLLTLIALVIVYTLYPRREAEIDYYRSVIDESTTTT
ncbi:MAG: MFS transporter [Actinobacteria bacterium]|nr:MFS transporter [Actinomycetota bacterium]